VRRKYPRKYFPIDLKKKIPKKVFSDRFKEENTHLKKKIPKKVFPYGFEEENTQENIFR